MRILSGVFEGATTGTPINLTIENVDQRPRDYSKIKDVYRPSHADYTYHHKYGDPRLPGRRSLIGARDGDAGRGREPSRRSTSANGPVSWCAAISPSSARYAQRGVRPGRGRAQPVLLPRPRGCRGDGRFMDALRKSGDSVGARIDVVASGVPPGARRAGVRPPRRGPRPRADEHQRGQGRGDRCGLPGGGDARDREPRRDHARGLRAQQRGRDPRGDLSSGQDIRASIALKPTSSLRLPGRSIDTSGNPVEVVTVTAGTTRASAFARRPAPSPRRWSLLRGCIVLMDHYLRHRWSQNEQVDVFIEMWFQSKSHSPRLRSQTASIQCRRHRRDRSSVTAPLHPRRRSCPFPPSASVF